MFIWITMEMKGLGIFWVSHFLATEMESTRYKFNWYDIYTTIFDS